MSIAPIQPNELRTCDLCQRRFSLPVYQRHVTENQCLKRNHHRLPFESIKQRSIRIGDKIISVRPPKPTDDVLVPTVAVREFRSRVAPARIRLRSPGRRNKSRVSLSRRYARRAHGHVRRTWHRSVMRSLPFTFQPLPRLHSIEQHTSPSTTTMTTKTTSSNATVRHHHQRQTSR